MTSTMTPPHDRPHHHRLPLGGQLREDWEHLCRRRPELRSLVEAAGLLAPGSRPRAGDPGPGDHADGAPDDAVLARLVTQAASDALAARVVLQRLLPGFVAIARRRGGASPDRCRVAFDELMAQGWIVIRTFPIERRPRRVAANLLRDIEYQAFTRTARLAMTHREVPVGDEAWPDGPTPTTPDALAEVVDLLVAGRDAGMGPADLALAARLAGGASVAEIARDEGVTERAVRYRRAAMAEQLRAVALGWVEPEVAC